MGDFRTQPNSAHDGWAFAKELSDVLILVRPLGGSELFVKRNGKFYADPFYCGQLLEQLREDHHQSIKDRVRAQRRIKELETALRDIMNASNDPYEVARAALQPKERAK